MLDVSRLARGVPQGGGWQDAAGTSQGHTELRLLQYEATDAGFIHGIKHLQFEHLDTFVQSDSQQVHLQKHGNMQFLHTHKGATVHFSFCISCGSNELDVEEARCCHIVLSSLCSCVVMSEAHKATRRVGRSQTVTALSASIIRGGIKQQRQT